MNEEQVIEVEYNEELVKDYQNNYIMEEEGIGAEMGEVYDTQTEFNSDTIDELINKDEVTIDSIEEVGGDE